MTHDYKAQGRLNKAQGKRFETKVRNYLELQNYTVCKWVNQLTEPILSKSGKTTRQIVPAKNRWNFAGRIMTLGTGFPDFLAFKSLEWQDQTIITTLTPYEVIGIEAKSNGQLNSIEKSKCEWYLKNNIFSKILIARKGKKRGEIVLEDFNSKLFKPRYTNNSKQVNGNQ